MDDLGVASRHWPLFFFFNFSFCTTTLTSLHPSLTTSSFWYNLMTPKLLHNPILFPSRPMKLVPRTWLGCLFFAALPFLLDAASGESYERPGICWCAWATMRDLELAYSQLARPYSKS